ncbi:MAG: HAD family phosphatase [bacterium]|nr:HAD family phosphatase [bacterium]
MITTVIFDMDDLMVNTSALHFAAYERVLQDYGIEEPIPEKLKSHFFGMRVEEIMGELAVHSKIQATGKILAEKREPYFMKLVREGVQPMPGLLILIENIKKWNLKRVVGTSGVPLYVNEVLRQLKLVDFFQGVVTGDQVKNPKPAPDTFLKAAEVIGSRPEECVVLEDSGHGVDAGKRAGMRVIGVRNSVVESGQDLSKADLVVNRLDEIQKNSFFSH